LEKAEVRERLMRDFPGVYTVVTPKIRARVKRLVVTYQLPPQDEDELFTAVANLEDAEALEFLDGFEKAIQADGGG